MIRTLAWLLVGAPLLCSACAPSASSRNGWLQADGLARRPAAPIARAEARGEPQTLSRVLFFIPDRALDFFDMASFGLGIGYGLDVNQQATCYLKAPQLGSYTSINVLNWYYRRNLCVTVNDEGEMGIGPFVVCKSSFYGIGTGWNNGQPGSGEKEFRKSGFASYGDDLFKDGYQDPWAVRVCYGPLIVGPRLEAAVHPVEIADFVIGLVTLGSVDISEDDWAAAVRF